MSANTNDSLYKRVIEAIFKDSRKKNILAGYDFPKNWCFSDEEWRLVQGILELAGEEEEFTLAEVNAYLDSYFHIDSKTLRFIDEGFMITDADNEFNFSKSEDAISYINHKGYHFKNWYEVEDAYETGSLGLIKCYHWNNTTNGVGAAQHIFDARQKTAALKKIHHGCK